jgi:microcystin-dependent protein
MSPRYYGNLTGQANVPSSTAASGSWVAATEIYRQKQTLNAWVSSPAPPAKTVPGSVVYALSSGTSDELLDSSSYVAANGQAISRTTYSSLFDLYGTLYGNGDGSTTFNVPDYTGDYGYLKTTTTSGATLAQLSGVAKIPSHTHSVTGVVSISPTPTSCGSGGNNNRNMTPITTYTGFRGSPKGNEARHRQVIPLIALNEEAVPVGTVTSFLLPVSEESFIASYYPAGSFLICSGQAVSRTGYPTLFRRLGTLYGNGDGSTTFNLPDLTGRFLKPVGVSQVSGVLPSGYILDDFAQHHHSASLYTQSANNDCNGPGSYLNQLRAPATGASSVGTASENRPNNVSVVYLVSAG